MKDTEKIQHLLPLGYLYLITVGILKESVLFYQLDINILKYSSIVDVLICPIATLISNPIIFITLSSVFVSSYYLPSILYKYGHNKWVKRTFELKKTKEELSDIEIKNYYLYISIKTLAIGLLSVYLGYGTAEGNIASKRIKSGKLKYDHNLTYNTGESEQVYLLESNSLYCFYVAKGEKSVKIAPIGSIKNIEIVQK